MAVLFLPFDMEMAFTHPWAVVFVDEAWWPSLGSAGYRRGSANNAPTNRDLSRAQVS